MTINFDDLRSANLFRQKEWDTENKIGLSYRACELGGEVGEVLNVCKKIERERLGIKGSRADLKQLADELADVVICCDLLAAAEGIVLSQAVIDKFNKTSISVGLKVRL